MAMEVESLELTIEDILLLHRGWITKLFVEDEKTEVEIVGLLYEHHLSITLQQIRRCIQAWDLLSSPSPAKLEQELDVHSTFSPVNNELQIDTHSTSDGWEHIQSLSNSPTRLPSSSNLPFPPDSPTYTPSPITADFDPETANLYKERPLPSLPSTSQHRRKSSTSLNRPTKDKLKLTCHHGPESHEVEMTLGILGQGPSPIETYASDDQSHERIAIGLKRNREESPTVSVRRAGEKGWGSGSENRMEKKKTLKARREKKKKDASAH